MFTENEVKKMEIDMKNIRKKQLTCKKKSYRKNTSKLDKYRAEIMHQRFVNDASFTEIQLWLRKTKKIRTQRSTIQRRINQWLEGER